MLTPSELKVMLLLLGMTPTMSETCVLGNKNSFIFLTSNSFSPSYPQAQEQAASAYSANYKGTRFTYLQSAGFHQPVELRSGPS